MSAPASAGSTSHLTRVRPGVVLKHPVEVWKESRAYDVLTARIANSFSVERRILEALDKHPRVVRYYGWSAEPGMPSGLLLVEASHGSLQRCFEDCYNTISQRTREKWCRQAVESIAYIHQQGVIHSNLRPENFLVHETTSSVLDIWLCDFGGSYSERLGVDGGHLPDSGFFDPNAEPISAPSTNIFSLGSVLYSIQTGHWPHQEHGALNTIEKLESYRIRVDDLFARREFPDVQGLVANDIIRKCWTNQYTTAEEILQDWDMEMGINYGEQHIEGKDC